MPTSVTDWHASARSLAIQSQAYIDGRYVPAASGETFDCVSPIDGRLLARALAALEAGDRASAAEAFAILRADLPQDPDALHAIGVLGLQSGDPGRALEPLSRAIALNPRQPAFRCHLAIAYRSLGLPERAIAELEAALSKTSASPPRGSTRTRPST